MNLQTLSQTSTYKLIVLGLSVGLAIPVITVDFNMTSVLTN